MLARIVQLLEYLPIIGKRLKKRRRKRELLEKLKKQDPYIYE